MPDSTLSRRVLTELPGPRARAAIAAGAFDMQSIYRAVIADDEKSQGPWLVDADGNVFLDLFASFALGALGYNHPEIVALAKSDAFVRASINPTTTPFVTTRAWVDSIAEIEARWAPPGMGKIYCVDSGGEGVECALKCAFTHRGEADRVAAALPRNPLEMPPEWQARVMDNLGTDAVVVSFEGAFHGRGFGSLTATHSKVIHKADQPAFPWPMVPFPASRWPLERHADENARAEAEALEALERVLAAHKVAAVIVEPMQSEGGDRHASAAFFRGVQARAAAAGACLVMDEVQTGGGTVGLRWAHEAFALPTAPDFVTFGKKMQLGGFFCRPDRDVHQFGRMYQTRNGDRARALLCAATQRVIDREHLLAHVREVGAHFLEGLVGLEAAFPAMVSQARGWGFALAFDLPSTAARDEFNRRCMQKGVFSSYTGVRSVRLRPHLVTTRAQATEAVEVFHQVARDMA